MRLTTKKIALFNFRRVTAKTNRTASPTNFRAPSLRLFSVARVGEHSINSSVHGEQLNSPRRDTAGMNCRQLANSLSRASGANLLILFDNFFVHRERPEHSEAKSKNLHFSCARGKGYWPHRSRLANRWNPAPLFAGLTNKTRKISGALQAAKKLGRAVGRGFIPGIKPLESVVALAPEGYFSRSSFIIATILLASFSAPAATPPPQPTTRTASLDDYRHHLQNLSILVASCAQASDPKTCDPTLIGPDDHVALAAEQRQISYDWLRALFKQAQQKDAAEATPNKAPSKPDESIRPRPRTTAELLNDAQARLTADLAQATALATADGQRLLAPPQVAPSQVAPSQVAPSQVAPSQVGERAVLRKVLSQREFSALTAPSARDTLQEKFINWLNRLFEGASRFEAQAAWVGKLIVWGFIALVCIALAWGLLQLERRWRIRLVPESTGITNDAASARPWQLWLNDARAAADAGNWRTAIHCLYWAAISRLESKRLWPADRARTPREYLAILAAEDPRRLALAPLTRSFEHVWYGGRPANEHDYRQADALAQALIASSKPAPSTNNEAAVGNSEAPGGESR